MLFGYIYSDEGIKYTFQIDQYGKANVFDMSNCQRNIELREKVKNMHDYKVQLHKYCKNKFSPYYSAKTNAKRRIAFEEASTQKLST